MRARARISYFNDLDDWHFPTSRHRFNVTLFSLWIATMLVFLHLSVTALSLPYPYFPAGIAAFATGSRSKLHGFWLPAGAGVGPDRSRSGAIAGDRGHSRSRGYFGCAFSWAAMPIAL
jgi:hypothetical protein